MMCRNRRAAAEADAWREFQRKLADAGLMQEAWALVEDGPPKNAPGSVYYLNLGAFLEDFRAPDSYPGETIKEPQSHSAIRRCCCVRIRCPRMSSHAAERRVPGDRILWEERQ